MTFIEQMRGFDIVMHVAYAMILIRHTAKHPPDSLVERITRASAAMCSIFLACTVWQYGRTPLFLFVHNIWELSVVGSAYYALRKP